MTPTRSPEDTRSATEAGAHAERHSPASTASTLKYWFFETILPLALAFLVVFAIRSSVIEAFKIPSGSMIPTLLIGDHIFVNKFAYGFKVPFSDLVGDEPLYLIKREPPKRGDIIVFSYPKEPSLYYIKRVIGTPGDTVEVRDKQLFINGKRIDRTEMSSEDEQKILSSLDEGARYSRGTIKVYNEVLDQGPHMMMVDGTAFDPSQMDPSQPTFCLQAPCTVPADSLFVMGDNRDYSNDSRFWGFVPFRNVKGRAMFIWLSMVLNFPEGKFTFRPERFGEVLH